MVHTVSAGGRDVVMGLGCTAALLWVSRGFVALLAEYEPAGAADSRDSAGDQGAGSPVSQSGGGLQAVVPGGSGRRRDGLSGGSGVLRRCRRYWKGCCRSGMPPLHRRLHKILDTTNLAEGWHVKYTPLLTLTLYFFKLIRTGVTRYNSYSA